MAAALSAARQRGGASGGQRAAGSAGVWAAQVRNSPKLLSP